jgi:hypothetical protein
MAEQYKPGDTCPKSGIYKVVHDTQHHEEHEVTVVKDEQFPPCNHCGHHPRFSAVRLAAHIKNHKTFKR